MSPIEIEIDQGLLFLVVDHVGNNIHATVNATDIPLELNRFLFPQFRIRGKSSAQAELFGTLEQLQGNIQVHLNDFRVQEEALKKFSHLQGDLEVILGEKTSKIDANLMGLGDKPIIIHAELPATFSAFPTALNVDRDGDISAHFSAEGEIAHILQLMITDTTSITGRAIFDLGLAGSINSPNLQGTIEIINGSHESLETGAVFKDMHAVFRGNGKQLLLESLTALDPEIGSVSAKGYINLEVENHFPFDIEWNINNVNMIHLDYADARASGNLHHKGNSESSL